MKIKGVIHTGIIQPAQTLSLQHSEWELSLCCNSKALPALLTSSLVSLWSPGQKSDTCEGLCHPDSFLAVTETYKIICCNWLCLHNMNSHALCLHVCNTHLILVSTLKTRVMGRGPFSQLVLLSHWLCYILFKSQQSMALHVYNQALCCWTLLTDLGIWLLLGPRGLLL